MLDNSCGLGEFGVSSCFRLPLLREVELTLRANILRWPLDKAGLDLSASTAPDQLLTPTDTARSPEP